MDNPKTLVTLGIEKYETKIYTPVFNILAPFVCCDLDYKICFTRTKCVNIPCLFKKQKTF
jgi:hypothetical protein